MNQIHFQRQTLPLLLLTSFQNKIMLEFFFFKAVDNKVDVFNSNE